MSKRLKIFLISVVVFILLVIGTIVWFLFQLRAAFGSECDITNEYKVKNYKVIEQSCLGWAGPTYDRFNIYENNTLIMLNATWLDSCKLRFRKDRDLYVYLNKCTNSLQYLKAKKEQLISSSIDSIVMFSYNENYSKALNRKQVNQIIKDWNKSIPFDYRDGPFDSIFYPNYHYKLKVYNHGTATEFNIGRNLIADKNLWTYRISSSMDTTYFKDIWFKE